MKKDTIQQELFKEFEANEKKGKKTAPGSILPRNYVLMNISYEQVIFISIGIIMLMVLLFSLGVERGRRVAAAPAVKTIEAAAHKKEQAEPAEAKAEIPEETKAVPAVAESTRQPEKPQEEVKAPATSIFTVQLVAYKSKKSAQKELQVLNKKGYKPFIITGGGYYQICVGEYKSQGDAQKALKEISKKGYSESFIRKR
jgi:cell division septation protein DedD